ncbi:sigma-70 family RNA polymerase sigma factor [Aquabacterium sp.]|uniref:sigma-70 family RNA polymerase sigma factor n=1 Tax=Aquabacterium sp. TaxID=1872578 RepID=UPI003784D6F4
MADWPATMNPPPPRSSRDDRAAGAPDAALDAASDAAADDARLMADFARGDAAAFDTLYARHQAALYRFVRRVLGPALQAQTDEVFQDTWLRVVHARERFAPQGASFRTWLFTLAQNRAIDLLRRSGRELQAPEGMDEERFFTPEGEPWLDWPAPGGVSNEDRLFWRRAGERLLGCLDELPAAQRVVFLMHHDDECTLDDIAQALELGFETAKSRLRYAMSKLRTCMGAYLGADALARGRG